MDHLLVVSRSMALAMRIADDHDVVEFPVERLDELAPAPDVDAVVLDLGEPFAAMQALNRLRERGFTTPVLIVSGFQPSWKDILGLSIDGVVVVPLPITRIALLEGIDRLLGRVTAEAEPSPSPPTAPSAPSVREGEGATNAQDSRPGTLSPVNGSAGPSVKPAPPAVDEPPARTGSPLAAPTGPSRHTSPEPDLFRPVIEPTVPTRSPSIRPRVVTPQPSSHPPTSPPATRPPASPPAASATTASRPPAAPPAGSRPPAARKVAPAATPPPAARNVAPTPTTPPAAPPGAPQRQARGPQQTPQPGPPLPGPPPGVHRAPGRPLKPAPQPSPQRPAQPTPQQTPPPTSLRPPQPTPLRPTRPTPQQTPDPPPPQTPQPAPPPTPGAHRAPQGHGISPFGSLRSRDRGSDRPGERHPGFTPAAGVQAARSGEEGDEIETWVRGLLDRRGHLFGVSETAQVLADEVIERGESDAAAVLVPDGTRWRVSGGVGLRELERRLLLDTSHWLISEIAVGGRALLIEDTDIVRPRLAGAPLAAWRHLLAVPVPEIHAAVVLARGQEAARFTERDLAAVVPVVTEAGPLLSAAMRMRELARALAPLRDVDP